MAKTRMMVNQVLMSIVTLVSFVLTQYEDFGRVTSIGDGLISNSFSYVKGKLTIKAKTPKTVHADKVTYQRSTAAGFFTLCLPYDFELPEGYTAWTLKKGVDGVAEFQAGGREVKAGEPYVIGVDDADKARKVTRAGASIDLSAENVTIAATTTAGLSLTKGAELKALVIQPDFSWKMAPMTSEMWWFPRFVQTSRTTLSDYSLPPIGTI